MYKREASRATALKLTKEVKVRRAVKIATSHCSPTLLLNAMHHHTLLPLSKKGRETRSEGDELKNPRLSGVLAGGILYWHWE